MSVSLEDAKKSPLARNSTQPANLGASPRQAILQRQLSAQSNSGNQNASSSSPSTTAASSLTSYLKYLLGMSHKPTKRTLSEEAECGTPESISEWLRQGSDPNEIDAYGYTPLINACLRNCIKSVKILISNGADINMQAEHGYTALHAAAQSGYLDIVETLIDNGGNMEIKNEDGDTALMLAVRSEHSAVIDALCKRGCDIHTSGFENVGPIDYAKNKKNLYLSDVLMKHDARQNSLTGGLLTDKKNSISEKEELDMADALLAHQAASINNSVINEEVFQISSSNAN